ncbi:MAG: MFS transporter [Methyloligellaceae bacterium]
MTPASRPPARTGRFLEVVAPCRHFARLVWPLSFAQLISWGTLYYSFTLFLNPMERDLGWGRTELTAGLTIGIVTAGLASMPIGRLIDRGYGRIVMTLGSVLAGALLFGWSQVQNLAAYFLLWLGLGVAMAATLYEPAFAVLVRSLGARAKQAVAAMTLVGGFASTLAIPLCHLLIAAIGWRDTLVVLAAVNVVLGGAIHLIAIAGEREGGGASAAGRPSRPGELAAALRYPAFWCLCLAYAAGAFAVSAVIFHMVPLLSERGYPVTTAVAAIAVIGPSQIAGRLLVTVVLPRLSLLGTGLIALGLPALGLLLLHASSGAGWTVIGFGICLGVGNGIATIARATSVAEMISKTSFGAVNGAMNIPISLGRAFAPTLASLIWAATGGYGPVLWVLIAVGGLSVLSFVLAVNLARTADPPE